MSTTKLLARLTPQESKTLKALHIKAFEAKLNQIPTSKDWTIETVIRKRNESYEWFVAGYLFGKTV